MKEMTWNLETKNYWVAEMQKHQDADRLVQGEWFDLQTKKGCFFGCAMQTEEDALEEAIEAMKLPDWLIYLAERIYEGLSKEEYLTFPVELLKAIPVNTDISELKHELAVLRLKPLAEKFPEVSDAINQVIRYHENKERTEGGFQAASNAASNAARAARDIRAAWSARAAASSAVAAARATVAAATWSDAAYKQERDNLLTLLKSY